MFVAEGLGITYTAGARAVDDFCITLQQGERLAIYGGCASGKTSLLKCIAGLYPATSGRILLNGQDITHAKLRNRNIQMIFEDLGLVPRMRLGRNLLRLARLQGLRGKEAKDCVLRLAVDFNLSRLLGQPAKTLPNEDIVRAAFLRTKLRNPDLTLIDNPFSMCKDTRHQMFCEMLSHMTDIKSTTIFATNSIEEAFSFADRIVFLHYGVVEQIASRNELLNNAASLIVEKTINPHKSVLETTLTVTQSGSFVNIADKQFPIRHSNFPAGTHPVIATFVLTESEDGIEILGTQTLYQNGNLYLKSTQENGTLMVRLNHLQTKTKATAQPTEIQLFDTATEKRLG